MTFSYQKIGRSEPSIPPDLERNKFRTEAKRGYESMLEQVAARETGA